MSHSTNGPGPTRRSMREDPSVPAAPNPRTPWDEVAPQDAGPAAEPTDGGGDDGDGSGEDEARLPFWRRMPVWLLVVIGVVLVGIIVAVVLLLTRPGPAEEVDPEVITLPLPTPTIDPIEREAGTPFFESLPSTVLVWALAEYGEDEEMLIAGAVEGYRLTYSDGERALTVLAGQWPTSDAAEAAFERLLEQSGDLVDGEEGEGDTDGADDAGASEGDAEGEDGTEDDAQDGVATIEPEEGIVEVDGEQVGRYVLRPAPYGAGELWWTNQSVLIRLQGPAEEIRDVFAAFPL